MNWKATSSLANLGMPNLVYHDPLAKNIARCRSLLSSGTNVRKRVWGT